MEYEELLQLGRTINHLQATAKLLRRHMGQQDPIATLCCGAAGLLRTIHESEATVTQKVAVAQAIRDEAS